MHTKDYVEIAKVLAAHREIGTFNLPSDFQFFVDDLCTYFAHDNSRFDAHLFNQACYAPADDNIGTVNYYEGR